MTETRLPGALVISLDFELLWGLRDRDSSGASFTDALLGARRAIPRILSLFEDFDVAATWATVGFLFARSRAELLKHSPTVKPTYLDPNLSPYGDPVGDDEDADPFHFAPTLIERIAETARQEVGSHTFSHYYCGEAGQTVEAFRADMESARAIAEEQGYTLRSIVFPRNQLDPASLAVLTDVGIRCYRGNPSGSSWGFSDASTSRRPWKRLARLVDAYGGADTGTVQWDTVLQANGLSDVRATCFLAPFRPRFRRLEGLRRRRIVKRVRAAAVQGRIVHLWWHPHNFGTYTPENLRFLAAVLEEFAACRERYGMLSLGMSEVDAIVRDRFAEAGVQG